MAAGLVEVRVPGSLSLTAYEFGSRGPAPYVSGDNTSPWDDDSDGTFAEIETFEHPDASYADSARGQLESVYLGHNPATVQVLARIRYQCLAVDMTPPRIFVENPAAVPTQRWPYQATLTTPGSTTPTWLDIPLVMRPDDGSGGGSGAENLIDWTNTGVPLTLITAAPFLRTYYYRYPRMRIFEAYLIVKPPRFYAPPCRNIKRGDVLDIGGARNYPPSKMRQTSSRGVGAY